MFLYNISRAPSAAETRANNAAWKVAERLAAICRDIGDAPIDTWAPKIIDAMQGEGDVFMLLDERPGYFHGYSGPNAYHSWLRTVRNSPVWGPRLFASMRQPKPRAGAKGRRQ